MQDTRGRLKIFLGASPGVGKTFAMLEEGHRMLEDGVDIVIGYVEDHGRAETRALVSGLELVPRMRLTYRGVELEEMDVDAILRRHPDVVLVDELAHSNIGGVARLKRWQDVQFLLDHGIDVITTLNIQHIEELADVIESITGVAVRETVPDRLIDEADEIHLVDLPADALIERLEDGKIYPPAQAARALEHFFTVGNLSALRELALRRTAEGVNDRLSDLMLEGGSGSSETHDSVAVLLNGDAQWGTVLRKAWRMASALHSPLVVVQSRDGQDDPTTAAHVQLAEDLGARIARVEMHGAMAHDSIKLLVAELKRHQAFVVVIGVHAETVGFWPFRRETLRERGLVDSIVKEIGPATNIMLVSL